LFVWPSMYGEHMTLGYVLRMWL